MFLHREDDGIRNCGDERDPGRFVDVEVTGGASRGIGGIRRVAVDEQRPALDESTGEVEMGILIPARAAVKPAVRHSDQQEQPEGDIPIESVHGR